jgi:ATP/maltotriose-dependent transcriptional regulator MalT/DNA-binding SARP family transcriptional activator
MDRMELLLSTKLSPPLPQRRLLPRPTLQARIREATEYRLTLVQAGTGYGKTTALLSLDGSTPQLFWYSIGEADTDPYQFLLYLIAAFRTRLPGMSDLPLAVLQEQRSAGADAAYGKGGPAAAIGSTTIDALINVLAQSLSAPALLVLDDYHFVADSAVIDALMRRFVTHAPPSLHVVLASRRPLAWPELVRWRARGEVLEIGREALAFQPDEIALLFRDLYDLPLAPHEVAALADKTEGWPIALQLVRQGVREGTARSVTDLLAQGPSSLAALFDYLADDLLGRQPPEVAAFMRQTSVLRELTPAACAAVTGNQASAALLARLHELDLFVVALGQGHYRYHHLFHDFLRQQAATDPADQRMCHRRAAAFFEEQGDDEAAIYHWLAAGEFTAAAAAMARAGEAVLRAGRLDTVAAWIDALPPDVLANHPLLQAYLGDLHRLHSRFDEALAWYAQAEQTWRARGDLAGASRALRGQALVYLDTVRPAEAESLLEEALRLIDGTADRTARARVFELLAENKLNLGQPDQAEALRAQARALREAGPAEDALSVRVKLRTGRIDEAQQILEAWAAAEREEAARGQLHPPRAHRETVLLLSFIHALRGQAAQAMALAQEGIALGERLHSPFITAVAHIRLGHAWQLLPEQAGPPHLSHAHDRAIECYQAAIAMGDRLAVRRIRAEALWGLTRAYGFFGDLEAARRAAAEGIDIARWAGDQWIAAHTELALGASCVLAGCASEAVEILTRVLATFRDCSDRLGRAATRLWLSLAYHTLQQPERFAACVDDLLALCEAHGYAFLFSGPALLGPPDPRRLIPVLLTARARAIRPGYVARLLHALGVPAAPVHPGYQLRVQTLGAFRVWRGTVEVAPRAWQRDKARQLFQLLLTRRGHWLQREEIIECLWPDLAPEAAIRDFKVALNALNKAIEPARCADAPFAFIAREGTAYRLRPEADLWLDAAAFEQACTAGLRLVDRGATAAAIAQLQAALQLYGGDYLPDALYEDWASAERERLLLLYLRTADRLAGVLLECGRYDEALDVCQRILARDPCWESAYRTMILAHLRQGNRSQALRTYQRCSAVLDAELGVEPAPATAALYAQIVHGDDPGGVSVSQPESVAERRAHPAT